MVDVVSEGLLFSTGILDKPLGPGRDILQTADIFLVAGVLKRVCAAANFVARLVSGSYESRLEIALCPETNNKF